MKTFKEYINNILLESDSNWIKDKISDSITHYNLIVSFDNDNIPNLLFRITTTDIKNHYKILVNFNNEEFKPVYNNDIIGLKNAKNEVEDLIQKYLKKL